mgnify:CR=1 FL=1
MSVQTPNNGRSLMTLLVTPLDRLLLNRIGEQDGDAAMSATIRKLIRQEAERRGITAEYMFESSSAAAVAAAALAAE